jgi:NDP-sugar pyrophosphorylase family protein
MYNNYDILIICKEIDFNKYPELKKDIEKISNRIKIFALKNWEKKGPVFDVNQIARFIDDDEEYIINYCDFFALWDLKGFLEDRLNNNFEGALPVYSGFHPHLISSKNLYASCLTDYKNNLIKVKEKYTFFKDKTRNKYSPGIHYFRSGKILKYYMKKMINEGEKINDELYFSLIYNLLVEDGLSVYVPLNVDFFCQWGTPQDLEEFNFWNRRISQWKI